MGDPTGPGPANDSPTQSGPNTALRGSIACPISCEWTVHFGGAEPLEVAARSPLAQKLQLTTGTLGGCGGVVVRWGGQQRGQMEGRTFSIAADVQCVDWLWM